MRVEPPRMGLVALSGPLRLREDCTDGGLSPDSGAQSDGAGAPVGRGGAEGRPQVMPACNPLREPLRPASALQPPRAAPLAGGQGRSQRAPGRRHPCPPSTDTVKPGPRDPVWAAPSPRAPASSPLTRGQEC